MTRVRAAAWSAARVFLAAAGAAWIATGADVFALDAETARVVVSAGVSALVLTGVNWLRPGDPRFGAGSGDDEVADSEV